MMSGHDKKFELVHSFAPSEEYSKRCLATWATKIRIKAASVAEPQMSSCGMPLANRADPLRKIDPTGGEPCRVLG
jgi:hypothetical protein